MASKLALGYGTVAGTRAAPDVLLDNAVEGGFARNFVVVANLDATNWLFVKCQQDPGGPFKLALPGKTATVAMGGPRSNTLSKLIGFATTPSEGATITLTAAIVGDKLAN